MSNQNSKKYDETYLSTNQTYRFTLTSGASFVGRVVSVGKPNKDYGYFESGGNESEKFIYDGTFKIKIMDLDSAVKYKIEEFDQIEILYRQNLSDVIDMTFPNMLDNQKPNWLEFLTQKYGPYKVTQKGKTRFYVILNREDQIEFEPLGDLNFCHTEVDETLNRTRRFPRSYVQNSLGDEIFGSDYWYFDNFKRQPSSYSSNSWRIESVIDLPRFGKYNLKLYKHYNSRWQTELEEEILKNKITLAWNIISQHCNKLLIRHIYSFEVLKSNVIKGLPDGEMIQEIKILKLPIGKYER